MFKKTIPRGIHSEDTAEFTTRRQNKLVSIIETKNNKPSTRFACIDLATGFLSVSTQHELFICVVSSD